LAALSIVYDVKYTAGVAAHKLNSLRTPIVPVAASGASLLAHCDNFRGNLGD
jgi:hypothetical protein